MAKRMISRRQLLKLIGIGALTTTGIVGYRAWIEMDNLENQPVMRPQLIGTTFSQLQYSIYGLIRGLCRFRKMAI